MKKAAKRVVNTLGAGDFFTVIEFNSNAKVIGNHNLMVRATKENKENFEETPFLFPPLGLARSPFLGAVLLYTGRR